MRSKFHGNAFAMMRAAERFLLQSLPVAGRVVPGRLEREDRPLLPVEAWREALANAFVHRDYAIGGGSVSVALFEDRLEVISIGGLHFGLTPEALFREHESRPWNPMIAHAFYRRGIIESWGRGTLKIARLMQEAGLGDSRGGRAGWGRCDHVPLGGIAGRRNDRENDRENDVENDVENRLARAAAARAVAGVDGVRTRGASAQVGDHDPPRNSSFA